MAIQQPGVQSIREATRSERSSPVPAAATGDVIYEQPLSERIRSFLRLEYLFERARHELTGQDVWSSRTAIEALIDIMSLMGRMDLKKDIIKELERHSNTL